jgi:hypothetical protein
VSDFGRVRQLQAELETAVKFLREATDRSRSQKDQLGALSSAGEWTCYALSELLHAGLFWLGLQRLLLKGGLQVEDLDELNRLDLAAATQVLTELGLASGHTRHWVETNYAEGLRHDVEQRLHQLNEAAAQSYVAGGLPEADLDGPLIIEYSYASVDELRTEICRLVRRAERRALNEKELRDLYIRIVGAVGVLGWAIDVAVNFEQVRAAASEAAQTTSQWAQSVDLRVWAALAVVGVLMMAWQSARTLGRVHDVGDDLGPAGSDGPRRGGPRRDGPRHPPATSPSGAPSWVRTASEPSSRIARDPYRVPGSTAPGRGSTGSSRLPWKKRPEGPPPSPYSPGRSSDPPATRSNQAPGQTDIGDASLGREGPLGGKTAG